MAKVKKVQVLNLDANPLNANWLRIVAAKREIEGLEEELKGASGKEAEKIRTQIAQVSARIAMLSGETTDVPIPAAADDGWGEVDEEEDDDFEDDEEEEDELEDDEEEDDDFEG